MVRSSLWSENTSHLHATNSPVSMYKPFGRRILALLSLDIENGKAGVEGSQVRLAVGHKPAIAINIGRDKDFPLFWVVLLYRTNGGSNLLVRFAIVRDFDNQEVLGGNE